MSYFIGTVVFQDVGEKRAKMTVRGVSDIATLQSFANQMSSRTRAKIVGLSVTEHASSVEIGSVAAGKWDSTNDKAYIFMEDTATGKSVKAELPAPVESMFEHDGKNGYIMLSLHGDAIVDDFNTATGQTLRFNKGYFQSRKTKSQV